MHSIRRALCLLSLTVATACATPNRQRVPLPDLDAPFSRTDVGRVYVMRAPQTYGSIRALRVYDADRYIGTIGVDGFLCWERTAGRNPLVVVYEGPTIDGGDIESVADLQVEAGAEQFFEVRLDDETKKPRVEQLSQADGRARIARLGPPEPE